MCCGSLQYSDIERLIAVGMSDLKDQAEGVSEPDIVDKPAEVDDDDMTLLKLIRSCRGKLGVLTHKQNKIQALMDGESAKPDKHMINLKCEMLKNTLEEFIQFQKSVYMFMSEEEQECDQMNWFESKVKQFRDFLREVENKMELAAYEEQLNEQPEELPVVRPEDSASHTGSIVQSTTSSTSSTRRLKAQVEAERAVILVCADMLENKHQMEIEEASLKAKKEIWQVESGLAESTAKLKVLEE